jgi:hypothetical protein
MSDGEDFDWGRYGDQDKIKFNTVGDTAVGNIVKFEHRSFASGDAPQITLMCDDGEIRAVLCSPMALQNQLKEKKPRVGDRIRIVFTEEKHTGQPSPAKLFEVDVIRKEDLANQSAPAAASAPAEQRSEVF